MLFRLFSSFLLSCAGLAGAFAYPNTADSLVRWNELKFINGSEKDAIRGFVKNKEGDFLRAFLGNSDQPDSDYKFLSQKIEEAANEIKASGALTKRNDKKIKQIYKTIHDRFLTQYKDQSHFYEIGRTGKYNCVTATALYCIFFERFNIPYAIKEKPTHVYAVAYPNAENILVESTSPVFGFVAFNDQYMSSYVDNLKKQKLIGGTELTSSTEELFNKYYFGTDNITLQQLVGIHYSNDAIFRREANDIPGSYQEVVKSYMYYPCDRIEFMVMHATAGMLEKQDLDPLVRAQMIGRISRMEKAGITHEMVSGEFERLTNDLLTKKNDRVMYRRCYDTVLEELTNEEIKNDIRYVYNYENGRMFYNQGNYIRAKPFFVKAFEAQPNNNETAGVFVTCLHNSLRNEQNFRVVLDTLNLYSSKFELIRENTNFKTLMCIAYLGSSYDGFSKSQPADAEKFLKSFETLQASDAGIIVAPDLIGRSYSVAAVHFFKKGQKTKALQLIDTGLKLAPGNQELRVRRQMITGGGY